MKKKIQDIQQREDIGEEKTELVIKKTVEQIM